MSTRQLRNRLWSKAEMTSGGIRLVTHELNHLLVDVGPQVLTLDATTLETVQSTPELGVYGFYHIGNHTMARYVYDRTARTFQLCIQYGCMAGTEILPKAITLNDVARPHDQPRLVDMMNGVSPYALIDKGIIVYFNSRIWTFMKDQPVADRDLFINLSSMLVQRFLTSSETYLCPTYELRFHGNTYALYQTADNAVIYGRKNNSKHGRIIINRQYEFIDFAVPSHEVVCLFFTDMNTGYLYYVVWDISQKSFVHTFRAYSVGLLKLRFGTPNLRVVAIANNCYVLSGTGIASYYISANQVVLPNNWCQ